MGQLGESWAHHRTAVTLYWVAVTEYQSMLELKRPCNFNPYTMHIFITWINSVPLRKSRYETLATYVIVCKTMSKQKLPPMMNKQVIVFKILSTQKLPPMNNAKKVVIWWEQKKSTFSQFLSVTIVNLMNPTQWWIHNTYE